MAELIKALDISTAWLKAMEYLATADGKASNLIVSIAPGDGPIENSDIRSLFDDFLRRHESHSIRRIRKVADTIFPSDFYHPDAEGFDRNHVYRMQRYAREFESISIPRGTYFDRLIDWPNGDDETYNQLEAKINLLKKSWDRRVRNGSAYELGISDPGDETALELRVQEPNSDKRIMGFPCLSHISLTLFDGQLDMTALYRNHYFVTKAYGNYLGLTELLRFICAEVGCAPGELVCISTHADAEYDNPPGKTKISALVKACRSAVGEDEAA